MMGTANDAGRIYAPCLRVGDDAARTPQGVVPTEPKPASRRGGRIYASPTEPKPAYGRAVALVVGLALAALLLAPGAARAIEECGRASLGTTRTCSGASYSDGIFYGGGDTGRWLQGNNRINVPGSAGATTTITATTDGTSTQSVGVYTRAGTGSNTWAHITVGGETDGTAHVVNVVQGTSTNTDTDRNNGVYYRTDVQSANNSAATTIELRRGVTIGSAAAPMKQNGLWAVLGGSGGRGSGPATITSAATIFAAKRGILFARNVSNIIGATTITNSGAISSGEEGIYLWYSRVVAPWVSAPLSTLNTFTGGATITNTGAIAVSGADKYGIVMDYRGIGAAEIDNEGDIDAPLGSGIHLVHANGDLRLTNNGAATLNNRGDIDVATVGLRLDKRSGAGATTLTNSGDVTVTVTADAAAGAGHAIWLTESGSGAVTITNSGDLSSKNHALYAVTGAANTGDLELTNSAAVASEDGDGVRLERGAEGDVTVDNSAGVSGRWHGVYVGKAARIDFDQSAGTIAGRTGVYLGVTSESASGDSRATDSGGDHDPAIDVDWTGGNVARGTAANDNGRFRAASAADVLAFDREAAAVKAMAETVHYGGAAGIEAHALSWRDVVEQVAKGDDPGAIADNAAQLAAVPTGATASGNVYVAQLRAALGNADLSVAAAVWTAIGGSGATSLADVTDAEIVTYLQTDNGATRTLLRNLLAQGLTDGEKSILRAVATNDGVDDALTAAGFSDDTSNDSDYWSLVKALLDRHHLDDVSIDIAAGSIDSRGDGVRAYYATPHDSNGGIDVTIGAGASVSGGVNGILVSGAGVNASSVKKQTVTVNGRVTGGTGAGVLLIGGGTVAVGATGRVEGDIRADGGTLTLTAAAGSVITGTVHDPTSAFGTVEGSIGRIIYSNGGTVAVAAAGALTGVEGEALRSEAGNLNVDVSGRAGGDVIADGGGDLDVSLAGTGRIDGDVRAQGGGDLTLTAAAGSVITGTVHDPTSAFGTVEGSIGRIIYSNGGTVAVAAAGALTGVEGEALRSEAGNLNVDVSGRAGGDVIADGGGDLDVSLAGTGRIDGDVRAQGGGDLTLTAAAGSVITGTVHDPTSAFGTVEGSIGRIIYSNGGTVAVAAAGALTGVEGEALRSEAGNLNVDVSGRAGGDVIADGGGDLDVSLAGTGRIDGDVRAQGGGDLTLTAAAGSVITGTVHDPTSAFGTVEGSIGRIIYSNGGTVAVAAAGALTGVEGEALRSEAGDLSVTIAGMATGDVHAGGNLTADVSGTVTGDVRSMGDLTAVISGMVTGDVEGLGAGEHTVTVSTGGVVTGTIHLAASTVYVDGTVGEVRFDRGGTLTIGPNGRILAREGVAVRNARGALAVTIEAAPGERPEEAAARVAGTIESAELTVTLASADGETLELALDHEGRILTGPPPHARVYEALPSILLGMSAPLTHAERMGAPRSPRGGWARVEGASGDWKAASSTTGAAYELKRHGVRAGFDMSVDANLLLGFSVHHVRGSADVAGGGDIEVRGSGAGVSAAYAPGGGFYLDGQVEATFYSADLDSDLRGGLKTGAFAFGLSMGAELGKRMDFRRGTLTPRARLVRSSISMDRFTDELDGRASIRDADSLKGSLGLLAEAVRTSGEGEFALRGSLDVEREFSPETTAKLDRDSLEAEAEATRVLVGLGARWRRGDFSIGGEVSAHGLGSDHESLGGRLTLGWRF